MSAHRIHSHRQRLVPLVMTAGLLATAGAGSHATGRAQADVAALVVQVREAETAFAKSMADRNHAAFGLFLSEEAVFVGGSQTLRGRQAVAEGWKPFFEGAEAPFSWAPERVEVLDSGTLALSSGPIRDRQGGRTGTFNSVWRRERDGWKIVFDKGCECR
jgi:ketosteroid isomerase-like protein